jgi:hypothetical protein
VDLLQLFVNNEGLCFFHANPKKASEPGRIGGRKNRHVPSDDDLPPLPPIQNAGTLRNAVAQLVEAIYSGKFDPKVGLGLAPLLNLQLRAIESSDFEETIARLEQENAEFQGESDVPDSEVEYPEIYGLRCPVQESVKERIRKLRQEIAEISAANQVYSQAGKTSLTAAEQDRRFQRLQAILEELLALTDWKKT